MSLVIQTAPTAEPIAVADLKRFWGVDFGEDDDRIAICGKAARVWVEHFTGRALVNRTYDLYLTDFTPNRLGVIRLPYPPLSSVTSIVYTATDGSSLATTLSSSVYSTDAYSEPGRIFLAYGQNWPSLYGQEHAHEVRIRYVAGMAASASALDSAQRQNFIEAVSVVGRAFYENPSYMAEGQQYRNETAEMLLWSDRFLGEVDGL